MVHNPKKYQMLAGWCVESVLGLIFKSCETLGSKLSHHELADFLGQNVDSGITHQQVSKMVYELKRREYVEYTEGDSVVLTNKAKIKIIDQITAMNRKDGKYRLVSFDIPEVKRTNRNNFRRAIKRMGFVQVQKSLWATDKNVGDFVEAAADEYKVNQFVAYFVADRTNIDQYISGIIKNHNK